MNTTMELKETAMFILWGKYGWTEKEVKAVLGLSIKQQKELKRLRAKEALER